MFATLPATVEEFRAWSWAQISPFYEDLLSRSLTVDTIAGWLADWSRLSALLIDLNTYYTIATTTNTADTVTEQAYKAYLDDIVPPMQNAEQLLKQKLINSGLGVPGFEQPLRKLHTEVALFCEANSPLLSELAKLKIEYDK